MHKVVMLGLAFASAATPALADYCLWIDDQAVAQRAAAMIKPGDTLLSFYPLDSAVAEKDTVSSPGATVVPKPDGEGKNYHYEVYINGVAWDLGHTYIRTEPKGPWTNLAVLVNGCQDVENDLPRTLQPEQVPQL